MIRSWTRVQPGLYRCGGYQVGRLDTGEWFAEGPGADEVLPTKREAQQLCLRVADTRDRGSV